MLNSIKCVITNRNHGFCGIRCIKVSPKWELELMALTALWSKCFIQNINSGQMICLLSTCPGCTCAHFSMHFTVCSLLLPFYDTKTGDGSEGDSLIRCGDFWSRKEQNIILSYKQVKSIRSITESDAATTKIDTCVVAVTLRLDSALSENLLNLSTKNI